MTDQPTASPFDGLDPDDYALTFAPAPGRNRHDGWTEQRQRHFILALRDSGCVVTAARAAGCTAQTAYRLRKRPDAAGFAAAWDRALDQGRTRMMDHTIAAALHGQIRPRFYRGRFVSASHGYDDHALAMALGAMLPRSPMEGYE
jgi:hypothetical protein